MVSVVFLKCCGLFDKTWTISSEVLSHLKKATVKQDSKVLCLGNIFTPLYLGSYFYVVKDLIHWLNCNFSDVGGFLLFLYEDSLAGNLFLISRIFLC